MDRYVGRRERMHVRLRACAWGDVCVALVDKARACVVYSALAHPRSRTAMPTQTTCHFFLSVRILMRVRERLATRKP